MVQQGGKNRSGGKVRNVREKGGSVVCFITVNPDTAAFSAHMDWIIGYVGCSDLL